MTDLYTLLYKMTEINQIQDEIIEEFADLDDWMDRYAYIIVKPKPPEVNRQDVSICKNIPMIFCKRAIDMPPRFVVC